MPYFPKQSESAYYCPRCKAWFLRGNVSCCVAHAPGTCCHYGETQVAAPTKVGGEENAT